MIKLKEAIVVEGRYDKAKLASFFDTIIVSTEGFGIFTNDRKLNLIRNLAKSVGVIILTDSDSAGLVIRNYLKGCITDGVVKHAFVPEIHGKEKRKLHSSKEGLLGVEGMSKDVIMRAIVNAGADIDSLPLVERVRFTKLDLYRMGLSGRSDSKKKREELLSDLGLPTNISSNALLEILPTVLGEKQAKKL